MASQREPYDVEVFGGQKCRLYPSDNWAERRVITGSQFFDLDERQSLANHMSQGSGDYVFVDAGANVGLYTLWVRSVAQKLGRNLKTLVVEPDPVNKARLGTNLAANQASEVIHCDKALSDKPGEVWFESANLGDRGHAKVAESGDLCVQAIPLLDAIRDTGLTKVDAMKMDIEGQETRVLRAFFEDAPREIWPEVLLIEIKHSDDGLDEVLNKAGYVASFANNTNGVYRLNESTASGGTKE